MKSNRISPWTCLILIAVIVVPPSFGIPNDIRRIESISEYQANGPRVGSDSFTTAIGSPFHARLLSFFREITPLQAGDAQADDRFGIAVAVSDDTAVMGAYQEDGGPGDPSPSSGAIYIFERDLGGHGNWGQAGRLTASDAQAGDHFGGSVAISGDTIVVGAFSEDGGPGDPITGAGAAYIFERDMQESGNWIQVAKLTADDPQPGEAFGGDVSIDGDTIVVGATGAEEVPGSPFPIVGAVYVFERDLGGSGNWGEAARLIASDAQDGDGFGVSVDVSGDAIVAGAWLKDAGTEVVFSDSLSFFGGDLNGLGNQGAAYIFERDLGGPDHWGEAAKLIAIDAQDMDIFGGSVGIDGDTVVVGAGLEDGGPGNPLPDSGAAYVFERSEMRGWFGVAKLVAGDAQEMDYFGNSVAISGDWIVAGAETEDGGPGDPIIGVGATYVFERHLGGPANWGEAAKLLASDGQETDAFGSSVAIAGEIVVVAAIGEDGGPGDPLPGAGAAYVFLRLEERLFLPVVFRE